MELQKITNQKVEAMKLEVMEAKAKFDRKLEQLTRELKDNKRTNEAIEEVNRKHQLELEKYIKEHNLKYNQLMQEKMVGEDRLKDEFEK